MIDLELESQVLAAMINSQDSLDNGLAKLSEKDFSDSFYRHVFKAVKAMYESNKTINSVTVYKEVEAVAKGKGTTWLALKDAFWPSGTFIDFVGRLKKLTKGRQLHRIAHNIVTGINNKSDIDELTAKIENEVYALSTESKDEPIVTPKEQANSIIEVLDDSLDKEKRKQSVLYTRFKRLNYATGGFEAGDLVIISGPTKGGKTAFAMNVIRDIAIDQKFPSLYINSEMSKKQMALRWAAILSKNWEVTNGSLRAGEFEKYYSNIVRDLDPLFNSELYSQNIPDLSIAKMMSTIRRFSVQKKVRSVVVDYIGRMDTLDSKNRDEWQLLLGAARRLKTMAQQYGIVVFMIAQVNSEGKLAMAKYMEHECDLHLHIRPISQEEKEDCLARMEYYWTHSISIEAGRSAPRGYIPVRFAGEKLLFISDKEVAERHAKLVGEKPEQTANRAVNENQGRPAAQSSKWNRNKRREQY